MPAEKKQVQEPHYAKAPTLQVSVRKKAIDTALQSNSGHCMIADEIKEQYPWAKSVSVDMQSIRVSDPRRGLRYIYLTPALPGRNLLEWDYGIKPEPFPFKLRGDSAMVVAMGRGHIKRAAQSDGRKRGDGTRPLPKKAKLVSGGHKRRVPRRVGGKEPPVYSGIRTFGLRNFKTRIPSPDGRTS